MRERERGKEATRREKMGKAGDDRNERGGLAHAVSVCVVVCCVGHLPNQQPCVIPTEPPRALSPDKHSFPPAEGKPPPPPRCHRQFSAQENFKERRNNPHNKQVEEEMNKG